MKFDLAAELAKLLKAQPEPLGSIGESPEDAGFAVIPDGGRDVQVQFEDAFAKRPGITATPQDLAEDITWSVVDGSTEGFAIRLSAPNSGDVTFTWTAFPVRDGRTTRGEASEEEPSNEIEESSESEASAAAGTEPAQETKPAEETARATETQGSTPLEPSSPAPSETAPANPES